MKNLLLMVLLVFTVVSGANEEKLKNTVGAQIKTDNEAAASQKKVTKVAEETKTLLDEYRATLRKIENTKVYNEQLRKLIISQQEEMVRIKKQIVGIKDTNQEIVPLMLRMITTVEEFTNADIPFLMDERKKRVADLKSMLNRADVSTSEKFRRTVEAYQIENEYGRTIEAYRGIQKVEGKDLTVDFLRVGRVAFVYQTLDGKNSGRWNADEEKWEELGSEFRKSIQEGLQIARKQKAPSLMKLPVSAPKEVKL